MEFAPLPQQNMGAPPPPPINYAMPPPGVPRSFQGGMMGGAGRPGQPYFRGISGFPRGPGGMPMSQDDFDGKRLRKSVMRKTVDYNASIIRSLEVSGGWLELGMAWNLCWYPGCRIGFGSEIAEIGEPCNLKVSIHRNFCHRPATWTIPAIQSLRNSSKQPQTR